MRAWAVVAFAVVLSHAAGSAAGERRFAVVVGHDLGLADEAPLRFAERDAERYRDLLVQLGGLDTRDAVLLRGATPEEVLAALEEIHRRIETETPPGESSWLFFYFGGHGDAETLHLGEREMAVGDLRARVGAIPATLTVAVLDACRTPRPTRRKGVGAVPSFDIGVLPNEVASGRVIVRSAQAGEPAHESYELGGAIFTHFWLSGLRGAADSDADGRVTLPEAYAFAYRQTVRRSAEGESVQHPEREVTVEGRGDLVLTRPGQAGALLVVPRGDEARHIVFHQPSGAVVAELVSSKDHPYELAVPAGRILVQRRLPGRFEVAEVDLPFGGRHELSAADFEERPYEQVARRGGALDLHPHLLSARYALGFDRLPGGWVTRHGAELGYAYGFGRWGVGVVLGLGGSAYTLSSHDGDELFVDLAARVELRLPVGVTSLVLWAGPEGRLLRQVRRRVDGARLEQAGLSAAESVAVTLGAGGGGGLSWRFPVGARWHLTVGGRASVLALRVSDGEASRWRPVPVLAVNLGVAYRF